MCLGGGGGGGGGGGAGILLIWKIVGQGPNAIAVGAGRGCLDIFTSSVISLFFLPLRKMARYRLKYFSKGR